MPTSMLSLWNTTTVSHWHDRAWRNRYYYNMSRFPIAGDFIRWQDDMNYWNDYFSVHSNSGGWENVKYPSKMAGSGAISGGMGHSSIAFVSKNLKSLYR